MFVLSILGKLQLLPNISFLFLTLVPHLSPSSLLICFRITVRGGLVLVILFHLISGFTEVTTGSKLYEFITLKVIAVFIYLVILFIVFKLQHVYIRHMQKLAFLSASTFFAYHLIGTFKVSTSKILAGAIVESDLYWGISSAYFFLFLFTKLRWMSQNLKLILLQVYLCTSVGYHLLWHF